MLITLKLDIHLVWLEHRLNFLNLRTNSIQNIIKSKTAPKVCQRNSSFLKISKLSTMLLILQNSIRRCSAKYVVLLQLWVPPLILANTYDRMAMRYSNSSTLVVLKEGNGTTASKYHVHESRFFKGSENPFQLSNMVSAEYSCDFVMKMFPFDNQTCYVEVGQK